MAKSEELEWQCLKFSLNVICIDAIARDPHQIAVIVTADAKRMQLQIQYSQ